MKGTQQEKIDAMRMALWNSNKVLRQLLEQVPLAREDRGMIQDQMESNDYARMDHDQ